MLISVVVPFYKEISLIARTIDSVMSQTAMSEATRFEICIGNDGPYTESEILAAIRPEYHDVINIKNNEGVKGPGGARNTAISNATGDILAFLDADDTWLPEKTAKQLASIEDGASFVATGYSFERQNVHISPPVGIAQPLDVFRIQGIGTSTVMITRKLLADIRFRDIRFSQDIDCWYRLANQPAFAYAQVSDALVSYSTGGSTRNKLEQAQYFWRVLRLNDISLPRSIAILARYGVRGVFNHYISR